MVGFFFVWDGGGLLVVFLKGWQSGLVKNRDTLRLANIASDSSYSQEIIQTTSYTGAVKCFQSCQIALCSTKLSVLLEAAEA